MVSSHVIRPPLTGSAGKWKNHQSHVQRPSHKSIPPNSDSVHRPREHTWLEHSLEAFTRPKHLSPARSSALAGHMSAPYSPVSYERGGKGFAHGQHCPPIPKRGKPCMSQQSHRGERRNQGETIQGTNALRGHTCTQRLLRWKTEKFCRIECPWSERPTATQQSLAGILLAPLKQGCHLLNQNPWRQTWQSLFCAHCPAAALLLAPFRRTLIGTHLCSRLPTKL